MLAYCDSLTELPLFSTESATYMYRAFYNCFNVQRGALAIYQQASTQTNPPTDHADCFANCGRDTESGLADLEQIPSAWGGNFRDYVILRFTDGVTPSFSKGTSEQISVSPNDWKLSTANEYSWRGLLSGQNELLEVIDMKAPGITDMYEMFKNCSKLTTVHVLDTTSCTKSIGYMFCGCSSLTTLPAIKISGDPYGLFQNCSSLSVIPELDTTEMSGSCYYMFMNTAITEVPNLNMAKVTYASSMFYGCSSLTDISRIASMDFNQSYLYVTSMFYNCKNVSAGILSAYRKLSSLPAVQSTDSAFKYCGIETVNGAAELRQVPNSWGGLPPDSTGTAIIGGRTYKTIIFGNKEWLAENLEYKFNGCAISTQASPITDTSSPTAWYYNNDEATYSLDGEKKCGLLYNTYALKYLVENSATLLSDGWRVPSYNDLSSIILSGYGVYGAKAPDNSVTATWPNGYNGLGARGLNVLPTGYFWSNSFVEESRCGFIYYYDNSPGIIEFSRTNKNMNGLSGYGISGNLAYSIRLVRDI